MYLNDAEPEDENDEAGNDMGMERVFEELNTLKGTVDGLETRLKETVDSALSREEGLRAAIDVMAGEFKNYSTPSIPAHSSHRRLSADETCPPVPAAAARPPIRMEFPQFGESRNSSDVTDFVEQCENFLTLRPLSDIELIGTLNTVLKGPARSWWLAARSKICNWTDFRKSFLEAFLPMDYQAKIEDQLRTNVQAPGQCLRDFAYDNRALCLKWRPDMTEADMVRRILNACNPRLASRLLGTVTTVEQLVKVGSLIEKDWSNTKDYWSRVQQSHGPNRSSGGDATTALGEPSLLVVPVYLRGSKGDAVLDSGCTYSLMSHSLWKAIQ
uniref:Retrotransposon gag domain-containing protein n=1 Tax=Knipowitschia caucasica TaxID=637954 RepID=A0AAV2ITY3_KNICA